MGCCTSTICRPATIHVSPTSQKVVLAHANDLFAINDLPPELLVNIFSFFPSYELIQLQRVCVRWRRIIRGILWKIQTAITERDLDPCAQVQVQLLTLLELVHTVRPVVYFYFPSIYYLFRNFELFNETVQRAYRSLAAALHKHMRDGNLPLHLNALLFLQKINGIDHFNSNLIVTLSMLYSDIEVNGYLPHIVDSCFFPYRHLFRRIIIAKWYLSGGTDSSKEIEFLQRFSDELTNVKEIIFDHLETEFWPGLLHPNMPPPQPEELKIFGFISGFATRLQFRVKKLSLHCVRYGVTIELQLSLDKLFSKVELVDLIAALLSFKETSQSVDQWRRIIAAWRLRGVLEDAAVRLQRSPRSDEHAFWKLFKYEDYPRFSTAFGPLLVELFPTTAKSLIAFVPWNDAIDLCGDLNRLGVLSQLEKLDIWTLREQSSMPITPLNVVRRPEEVLGVDLFWNGLSRSDRWRNLRYLRLYFMTDLGVPSSQRAERVDLASTNVQLPFLEYFNVCMPLDYPVVVTIIRSAPRLRHLRYQSYTDFVLEQNEERERTRLLLAAISEKTTLVSLCITIGATDVTLSPQTHHIWLAMWLDGVLCETLKRSTLSIPLKLHLRQEVLDTIRNLASLSYLELDFQTGGCIDPSCIMEEMERVQSSIPSRPVIRWNDYPR